MALNGSGLGVAVGSSSFVFGAFKSLDVLSVADPTNTGNFITRIDLPSVPNDVALANGLAFVADGTVRAADRQLRRLRHQGRAADRVHRRQRRRRRPGDARHTGARGPHHPRHADHHRRRAGAQRRVAGRTARWWPTTWPIPFDLSAQAPTIASGGNTVTLQVRATDTGGNATLSNAVVLNVVPDTFAPQVQNISIAEGASLFFVRSINLTFDEPLDLAKLSATGVTLVKKGPDGVAGTADDIAVPVTLDTRSFGQVVSMLPAGYLLPGDYQLRIDPSVIADRSGNALTNAIVRNFIIKPASDIRAASGIPDIGQAPSANPGQSIGVSVPVRSRHGLGHLQRHRLRRQQDDARRAVDRHGCRHAASPTSRCRTMRLPATPSCSPRSARPRSSLPMARSYLQIVPVVVGIDVTSVASDGTSAQVTLSGFGLVEDNASEYRLGSTTIVDGSVSQGPDVYYRYDRGSGLNTLQQRLCQPDGAAEQRGVRSDHREDGGRE